MSDRFPCGVPCPARKGVFMVCSRRTCQTSDPDAPGGVAWLLPEGRGPYWRARIELIDYEYGPGEPEPEEDREDDSR